MQLFYAADLVEGVFSLPPDEARHAVQVLRHRVGDELTLIDGRGGWYVGHIVQADRRECTLDVRLLRREARRAGFELTLAVAPTKQIDRMEWLVEKATEIGVDRFVPLLCQRSERTQLRIDRLEKVAVAAAKQSLQAWIPVIEPLTPFLGWVNAWAGSQGYIGWCDESEPRVHLWHNCKPGGSVAILIGPEGDFTPDEVQLAMGRSFVPVSLGAHRLRTETAALAACQMLNLCNLPA